MHKCFSVFLFLSYQNFNCASISDKWRITGNCYKCETSVGLEISRLKVTYRYRCKITFLSFANAFRYVHEEKSNSRTITVLRNSVFSDALQTGTRVDIPARRENKVLRVGISSRGTPEGLFCQPVMSSPLGTIRLFVLIVLYPTLTFFSFALQIKTGNTSSFLLFTCKLLRYPCSAQMFARRQVFDLAAQNPVFVTTCKHTRKPYRDYFQQQIKTGSLVPRLWQRKIPPKTNKQTTPPKKKPTTHNCIASTVREDFSNQYQRFRRGHHTSSLKLCWR